MVDSRNVYIFWFLEKRFYWNLLRKENILSTSSFRAWSWIESLYPAKKYNMYYWTVSDKLFSFSIRYFLQKYLTQLIRFEVVMKILLRRLICNFLIESRNPFAKRSTFSIVFSSAMCWNYLLSTNTHNKNYELQTKRIMKYV